MTIFYWAASIFFIVLFVLSFGAWVYGLADGRLVMLALAFQLAAVTIASFVDKSPWKG